MYLSIYHGNEYLIILYYMNYSSVNVQGILISSCNNPVKKEVQAVFFQLYRQKTEIQ